MYVPTTRATRGFSPTSKPIVTMPWPTHQLLLPLRSQRIGLRLPLQVMRVVRRQRLRELEVELLGRPKRLEGAQQVIPRARRSRRAAMRVVGLGRGLWGLME